MPTPHSSTQLLKTPTTHSPYSLFRILDSFWSCFAEVLTSAGSRVLNPIAESTVLNALTSITTGKITLITNPSSPESTTHRFGDPSAADLEVTIRVNSAAFYTRIALFTDLGLAEAFMFGDIDCDDISTLIQILILNRPTLTHQTSSLLASALSHGRHLTSTKFLGTLTNSRANISAHYDLGNTMFKAFLSQDMNYSSAIFKDYNEDLNPIPIKTTRESLEDAQLRKVRLVLKKANIQPGQCVFEIGTGWASLAILAAKTFDCTIHTLTLSSNQAALARTLIEHAELSDKITVHCMDFRSFPVAFPALAGTFDRFISVEMIEHVGKDFLNEYWRVADWALKEGTGRGVVQGITLPESRVASYNAGVDFIQKWVRLYGILCTPPLIDLFQSSDRRVIFPGGYLPSLTLLVGSLNSGSQSRLIVDSVLNIGPHYARTLREWKRNFLENWEGVIAKALVEEYNLDAEELEVFRRKWIYYFDYCEAGFKTRTLGDHIITFTREGNIEFGCDIEVDF
ncbi:CFS1-like protein [Favolaschia claudopus]|uniref:CFS1-like protein n=1 Tax=Favolaschia claudopus TaxID=2862362 RepID=A0AAW0CHE4_9AGAR